ncbi:MAG: hypothetical protein NT157_00185 [Candidatus Micrarchaeota archaeon]|nr:hypothetical protein [Candidatus Micrarchaeota archaeon]
MSFARRNAKTILQMLLIGILILLGVFMISSTEKPPSFYDYNKTYDQVLIGAGPDLVPEPDLSGFDCTPMEGANEKKSWAYRVDSLTDGSTVQIAYKYSGPDAYEGKQAILSKLAINGTDQGTPASFTISLWSDPGTKACLGASMSADSTTAFELPISCQYVSTMFYGPLCRETMGNYTVKGNETVSVPAGVFETAIYTSRDGLTTMWLAPDVPLPVKISASDEQSQTQWMLLYYGDKT